MHLPFSIRVFTSKKVIVTSRNQIYESTEIPIFRCLVRFAAAVLQVRCMIYLGETISGTKNLILFLKFILEILPHPLK